MKITRKQLRQIIKEAMRPIGSATTTPAEIDTQQEAAYAAIYALGYLKGYKAGLAQVKNNDLELYYLGFAKANGPGHQLVRALKNVHETLVGGVSGITRDGSGLPEYQSILQEGKSVGELDFMESPYKYIEQVEILVDSHTPMGMSAVEAFEAFGVEGGGSLMADLAAADARDLTALLDDDNITSWLDQVDGT